MKFAWFILVSIYVYLMQLWGNEIYEIIDKYVSGKTEILGPAIYLNLSFITFAWALMLLVKTPELEDEIFGRKLIKPTLNIQLLSNTYTKVQLLLKGTPITNRHVLKNNSLEI